MAHTASAPAIQFTPWWWEWAPLSESRAHSLPPQVDCIVVGSGYTGLHAAITLARAGREVLVIDQAALGEGASTRNGGQVGSGNQHHTVADLEQRYAPATAQRLLEEGVLALDYITDFIRKEKIDCYFATTGRFRGAISAKHYEALAREFELLNKRIKVAYFMVAREQQHTVLGTDFYHGGVVLPNDASLHPSAYHAGLLKIARKSGVTLVSHCHVSGVTRNKQDYTVHTALGAVRTRQVIIATNGYSGDALPYFRCRVVPIGSAIIATDVLPVEQALQLIPQARVIGDTRRLVYYYRLCPAHCRVLFGGRIKGTVGSRSMVSFEHLRQEMIRIFPTLSKVPLTHCWSGYVARTHDMLPHIGNRAGMHYAMGYCGSGVSRSSYAGCKVAQQILRQDNGHSPWSTLPFQPYPLHRFHPLGVKIATAWKHYRDQRDLHHR